ncbi:WxL domain-containing protein [Vagococcus silagei]|uniref:WxL domain-containing protein n=1 Tax=Vagococcus silagei TaxID=2508885 RepID=A0A4S3AZ50_9ENTE|nr:WxL domain-containing protein [Vagococcus silagei]THB60104.1 WxL domain-containing protein [Vagococcus silagei]
MKNVKLVSAAALFAVAIIGGQVANAAPRPQDVKKENISRVELKADENEKIITPPDVGPPTGPYVSVGVLGITSTTNLLFPEIKLTGKIETVNAQYVDASKGKTEKQDTYLSPLLAPKPNLDSGGFSESQLDKVFVPGYSVTDTRGTGQGWHLTASIGNFEKFAADGKNVLQEGEEGYRKLKGAFVTFPPVKGITVKEATIENPNNVAAGVNAVLKAGDPNAVSLANAPVEEGRGVWEFRYDPYKITYKGVTRTKNPVTLTVPADNYAGAYQATMTWNLADAPVGDNA